MAPETNLLAKLQRVAYRIFPRFLLARLDPVEKLIQEHVNSFAQSLPEGALVLDAGAGEARFRSVFARQRYIGIDNQKGDAAWDYSGIDVTGDLLNLPFRDDCCGAALSIVVLEHTADPGRVLVELHRVLLPGGRLLIAVPMIWEVHQAPQDFFRYTQYGLARLLASAGFETVSLAPMGGFFWLAGRYSYYFLKFWRRGFAAIFLPILAPFFGLLIPLLCYYLDPLDRSGQYTLGYICEARKRQ